MAVKIVVLDVKKHLFIRLRILGLRLLTVLNIAALAMLVTACSPRALLVRSAADGLAAQSPGEEEDLGLARESSAFYLKLSESVLRETPGHLGLAETVASGFTQYAYAFVAQEADQIEGKDARAALRLRERAAHLYARAKGHAMRALEVQQPGFATALANPNSPLAVQPTQVGVAYWAAASWAGQISLSKHLPDVVADLPLAIRLAELAWATQPGYGEGALASLLGTLESARPNGTATRAAAYFDQAQTLGGARNAGVFVARAEALALPAGDKATFEALLRQALSVSAAHPTLGNQVMGQRAQFLLDAMPDLF